MDKIIATYPNDEDGLIAFVTRIETGFSITLRDTDAGETLPIIRIYPYTLDGAEGKAKDYAASIVA